MAETLQEKIKRVLADKIEVVDYNPEWPCEFELEKAHLLKITPPGLLKRIEHFGSTAVPGLAAKPVIDLLIEVADLNEAKITLPPLLEAEGYDYFWRPTCGNDGEPWYCWFIKRDTEGKRVAHLHVVEAGFPHWERLCFRDYLRQFPNIAATYADLKKSESLRHAGDRIAYTAAKSEFIQRITAEAKAYFGR